MEPLIGSGSVEGPIILTVHVNESAPAAATAYLDEHGLVVWVKEMLSELSSRRPEDPWTDIESRAASARKEAACCRGAVRSSSIEGEVDPLGEGSKQTSSPATLAGGGGRQAHGEEVLPESRAVAEALRPRLRSFLQERACAAGLMPGAMSRENLGHAEGLRLRARSTLEAVAAKRLPEGACWRRELRQQSLSQERACNSAARKGGAVQAHESRQKSVQKTRVEPREIVAAQDSIVKVADVGVDHLAVATTECRERGTTAKEAEDEGPHGEGGIDEMRNQARDLMRRLFKGERSEDGASLGPLHKESALRGPSAQAVFSPSSTSLSSAPLRQRPEVSSEVEQERKLPVPVAEDFGVPPLPRPAQPEGPARSSRRAVSLPTIVGTGNCPREIGGAGNGTGSSSRGRLDEREILPNPRAATFDDSCRRLAASGQGADELPLLRGRRSDPLLCCGGASSDGGGASRDGTGSGSWRPRSSAASPAGLVPPANQFPASPSTVVSSIGIASRAASKSPRSQVGVSNCAGSGPRTLSSTVSTFATGGGSCSSSSSCTRSTPKVQVPRLRLDNLQEKIKEIEMRRRLEKLQAQAERMGIQPITVGSDGPACKDMHAGLQAQLQMLTALGDPRSKVTQTSIAAT